MPRSKSTQVQMKKKVIEIYQSGTDYGAISKALRDQGMTVRVILNC